MNRLSSIVALGTVVLLVVACGASSGGLGSVPSIAPSAAPSVAQGSPDLTPEPTASSPEPSTSPSGEPGATPTPTPTPMPSSSGTSVVRAYFVLGGEPGVTGLVPVLREVPKTVQVATAAMNALLAGPTAAEAGDRTITSAVPEGSQLLGLSIKNGVATVDLSSEFDSGGGTTSTQYRLGQVVYTLTQFPTVKSVIFQIDGRTVTVFGSEGIVLDGPVGRDDYLDLLPSMFVDRPAYGAALGNPGHVTGSANVFEATFRIALLDGSGATLVDQQVMATCGTGCRGTFDTTLRYDVPKAQWGTLRVYDPSEKDGTPEDVRDYPVWLTPAK